MPADETPSALAIQQASTSLIDGMIAVLESSRDELVASFAHRVARDKPRVCTRTSERDGSFCDRSPGHSGCCSWEMDEVIRRYRNYEEAALSVPDLTNQLATARHRIKKLEKELEPHRKKRR